MREVASRTDRVWDTITIIYPLVLRLLGTHKRIDSVRQMMVCSNARMGMAQPSATPKSVEKMRREQEREEKAQKENWFYRLVDEIDGF